MRGIRFLAAAFIFTIVFGLSEMAIADVSAKRVLLVTTDAGQVPTVYNSANGAFVITDLAAAGYPFDIVNYTEFLSMDLGNHDIIILNGHTSPHSISDVLTKCQFVLSEGRKVFINGDLCNRHYSSDGKLLEYNRYALNLFNVTNGVSGSVSGATNVPEAIEKDPMISDVVWQNISVNDFGFRILPAMTITLGGKVLGFLYPQGGTIDSNRDQALTLLDYGKVVSYLRYGDPGIVGFANDRIDGKPIVSFEVHCDTTNNLVAIDGLNSLSIDMDLPLVNLLVYRNLTTASIAKWNAINVANSLMVCGSHSRSHPQDWPSIPDVLYETTQAIQDQQSIIPCTVNYLSFSGNMNPTTSQIDQMYQAGLVYGGKGYEVRAAKLPSGSDMNIQLMPTCRLWVQNLSNSNVTPFCLSQTLLPDNVVENLGKNYCDEMKNNFAQNVKYGLYSYGFFHDYMLDPTTNHYNNGIHMSQQIRSAMSYLKSESVKFVRVDELALRLRDFLQGWIDYEYLEDGTIKITVNRPSAKANQVKILVRGAGIPSASGSSVISQHLYDDFLYVDLVPEVQSTFYVNFTAIEPVSISNALSNADRSRVRIEGIVTAVFSDGCYIEQSNHVRGIKVLGRFRNRVGDKVAFDGVLATINGERVVNPIKPQ